MRPARLLLVALSLAGCRTQPLDSPAAGDLGSTVSPPDLAGAPVCGTIAGIACPDRLYCDLMSACRSSDPGGVCVAVPDGCAGSNGKQAECGCDGRTYASDCERLRAHVPLDHLGGCDQPCLAAGGYCQLGDAAPPTCKPGYDEATNVESAHPGVCGLGICCVPLLD